jgi:hypothetical protein
MERVAILTDTLGSALTSKNRERAMRQISDTGRHLVEQGQTLRTNVMDRIPIERIQPGEAISLDEKPSTIRQIGYALSLVPVVLALVRNPLVRDMALRRFARRSRPRRRR